MKDYSKFFMIGLISGMLLATIISAFSFLSLDFYTRRELDAFNRINKTEYTLDQWEIYSYEIKKAYPFIKEAEE